jgi:hypothetical protein
LRSKQKERNPSTSNQPKKSETSTKTVVTPNKGNDEQNNKLLIKAPIQETKEILRSPSYFIFENEIQKIKILVPFLELIKNEYFKKSISKMLQPDFSSHSTDSINLQDEKPAVILGPLV